MSSDTIAPVSPAIPPIAAPKAAGRKPRLDERFIAPITITCILIVGQLTFGVLESYTRTGLAILTSIVMELILGRLFTGKWPHLASAYISGISIGILIHSNYVWPYALCSAISITSKYVIRVNGRHIWNPSNLGIVCMLLLAPQYVSTLNAQFSNTLWPMVIIWTLGSIIIYRLKRFHIVATYVSCFIGYAYLRSLQVHDSFLSEVAPITGPMYQLFIFFMITDPKTTVKSKWGQAMVAFLVATAEHILRLNGNAHAPYYALTLMGPSANLIEIWRNSRKPVAVTSLQAPLLPDAKPR